jgi:hypothetical protein
MINGMQGMRLARHVVGTEATKERRSDRMLWFVYELLFSGLSFANAKKVLN